MTYFGKAFYSPEGQQNRLLINQYRRYDYFEELRSLKGMGNRDMESQVWRLIKILVRIDLKNLDQAEKQLNEIEKALKKLKQKIKI